MSLTDWKKIAGLF